jgi:hypothetical protein
MKLIKYHLQSLFNVSSFALIVKKLSSQSKNKRISFISIVYCKTQTVFGQKGLFNNRNNAVKNWDSGSDLQTPPWSVNFMALFASQPYLRNSLS